MQMRKSSTLSYYQMSKFLAWFSTMSALMCTLRHTFQFPVLPSLVSKTLKYFNYFTWGNNLFSTCFPAEYLNWRFGRNLPRTTPEVTGQASVASIHQPEKEMKTQIYETTPSTLSWARDHDYENLKKNWWQSNTLWELVTLWTRLYITCSTVQNGKDHRGEIVEYDHQSRLQFTLN